jgi:hypothetical protein
MEGGSGNVSADRALPGILAGAREQETTSAAQPVR